MAFLRTHGVLVARILMGGLFIQAGVSKLLDAGGTAGYIASAGLPESVALAYLAGLFELVLGLALLVGKKMEEAAVLLAVFVLVVSFLFHGMGTWEVNPIQQALFVKNIAIIAGLLYMAAYGPGNGWKLDKGA